MSTWKMRGRPPRLPRSSEWSIPAPTGGWNQRDVLSAMAPNDAIILTNWISDIGAVQIRKGYSSWGTGLTGSFVESLMQYSPPSGVNKLFAATPTIIYNVTSTGAGASSKTGLTNGRHSHVMFSNGSGNFLYTCNGADTPAYYDGAAWNNTTFTGAGLTITDLDFVHAHLNRLWFLEKNSLNAWYADISAIGGTLHKLILGPFCPLGGKLVALGSWTRDGGTGGADDYLVLVTSKGQIILYSGIDPADISSGSQVGVFKVAEPIGRRCLLRLGSDLGVLTSQGLVSMLQTLPQTEGQRAASTVTDKIIGAVRDAYQTAGTSFGWQVFEYPKKNLLIMNVPVLERAIQNQYVMNTRTGAWSRFININAGCWSLLGDIPFFGGNDGKVYKFDTDYNDAGDSIVATIQTAFTNCGTPTNKVFSSARGLFLSPSGYTPRLSIKTNYDTSIADLTVIDSTSGGTYWDVGSWDVSEWGSAQVPSLDWQTVNGEGAVASIAFSISAQSNITFNNADVMFEAGGLL